MADFSIARRYALALSQAVGNDADAVLAQLQPMATGFGSDEALMRALSDRGLELAERAALANKLIAGLPGLDPRLANFLRLLALRDRLGDLPAITQEYQRLADAKANRARADVASAAPLAPAQLAAIRTMLEGTLKKTVVVRASVDPNLIGGVVAQVGSKQYDGSLRSALVALQHTLEGRTAST